MIMLRLENQSMATINYLSDGDKSVPRERLEIFGGGAIGVIDNFRSATYSAQGKKTRFGSRFSVNRGTLKILDEVIKKVRSGMPSEVGIEEYINTSLTTFAIEEALSTRCQVSVKMPGLKGTGEFDWQAIQS